MTKIAVLQLPTLALSEARLDYYLKVCKDNGVSLILLGEYVLNSFFKELENMPISMIKKQSEDRKESLINLAKKYDITIIAPLVLVRGKDIYKVIAKISQSQTKFYEQQFLMQYSHWNEAKFFKNEFKDKLNYSTFKFDDLKFGVMFGYEAHFDASFVYMMKKNVDVLLIPTACTFETNERWCELLKMRAFTNNVYILRANRIGHYKNKNIDESWNFYGDSMLISPFGEVSQRLGSNEEMMISNLDKKEIITARGIWGFKNEINKKKLLSL
ncbi:hydrolase, carbon-nitrogen family [Campylobacter pinnipediorum subsp. pinnipediorum]|uniref:carbon-nitrogen hydrolase family protein n=1 Tax=Campylobacter pinnipediorum TaxID=1965231 RepID=UPI0009955600|nr:carbon-nitrogen hydrolase family protein [Campylobacter pinnipediorum]AQW82026.1 hydrolase, carbon-nitrogen family [Campylobacter pinnipediorum subsp. pinnipediorum]AQW85222.1 hydrolase, carbon-nitrogen family [Campylobacter pinnipediorum subsp. pinnipediorum]OPA74390.1 carbon-nitrogen hydrolase [Campylobacter pinnipediorum subsp. pinnipediorum]